VNSKKQGIKHVNLLGKGVMLPCSFVLNWILRK